MYFRTHHKIILIKYQKLIMHEITRNNSALYMIYISLWNPSLQFLFSLLVSSSKVQLQLAHQSSCIQQVLTSFVLHFQLNQLLSQIFVSIMVLLFFILMSREASIDSEFLKGSWGLPVSVDPSIILVTSSNTSLIFGRALGFRAKHRLAMVASLWTDLREYLPSSLGSNICRNLLGSDKYGFTHSSSFCSPLGRFRSTGLLPVISS